VINQKDIDRLIDNLSNLKGHFGDDLYEDSLNCIKALDSENKQYELTVNTYRDNIHKLTDENENLKQENKQMKSDLVKAKEFLSLKNPDSFYIGSALKILIKYKG